MSINGKDYVWLYQQGKQEAAKDDSLAVYYEPNMATTSVILNRDIYLCV